MVGQPFQDRPVVVAGAAVAGSAAARALLRRGAQVTVVDRCASPATDQLAAAGARVVIADQPPPGLFTHASDLVVSPGFAPHHPLVTAARAAGLAVYSEPELAWALRGPDAPPWLAVTGTNGKTTTVTMLAAILRAAGLRTATVGNIGEPLVDLPGPGEDGYDVLAVELSSQQLHWSRALAPPVGALLNLADDHLEWHGGFEAYVAAKLTIWRASGVGAPDAPDPAGAPGPTATLPAGDRPAPWAAGDPCAIGNLDDPRVAGALAAVPGRTVGFTLAAPQPGQFGLVDGVLIDHAFAAEPVPLLAAELVRPVGRHQLANALAAAALARAHGVPAQAVRDGLAGYRPEPHRNAQVAEVGGVAYVDDSKATNPHAALASLRAYPRVVWIAGGQLKGVDVADLVRAVADRLAGAVLLGVDRAELAAALTRHAPTVPIREVGSSDPSAMGEVVRAAAALAAPGDTVLLAPAAASRDMFPSFAHRGEAFAAAVRALESGAPAPAGGPARLPDPPAGSDPRTGDRAIGGRG